MENYWSVVVAIVPFDSGRAMASGWVTYGKKLALKSRVWPGILKNKPFLPADWMASSTGCLLEMNDGIWQ
jgi:hypothetical protein